MAARLAAVSMVAGAMAFTQMFSSAQLGRQHLGQRRDRRLAGGVGHRPRPGHQRRPRGHVQHPPPGAAGAHAPHRLPAAQQGGDEVQLQLRPGQGGGGLAQLAHRHSRRPGAPTPTAGATRRNTPDRLLVAQVDPGGDLQARPRRPVPRPALRGKHRRPGLQQPLDHRRSQAAPGAGHDHVASLQLAHDTHVMCVGRRGRRR